MCNLQSEIFKSCLPERSYDSACENYFIDFIAKNETNVRIFL